MTAVNLTFYPFVPIQKQPGDFTTCTLQEIEASQRYKELYPKIKGILKTELHAHLGGAVSMQFLERSLSPVAYAELTQFIVKLKKGNDYSDSFKAFKLIAPALDSNAKIEAAANDFCFAQFMDEVNFSELRTGLKRLNNGTFEDYLKAVLEGLRKGQHDFGGRVNLVLSLRRDTTKEDAEETVNLAIKYRDQGITGIDISGESTKGDGSGIFEAIKRAKAAGFPVTLHIGESPNETPDQQMKELEEIQPERVGHTVHLCPAAVDWIKTKKVIVEACLRSALSVNMIKKPGDHPALALLKEGHPVVFCSDDSTLFGTLSEELTLAACLCDLSIKDIEEIQRKAVGYAFQAKVNEKCL